MSIFKDTFPEFVSTQIKKRQDTFMVRRNPQDLSYINSRKAWVRLTSGVNTEDPPGSGKYTNTLAKQYILHGGTLFNINDISSQPFTGSLRNGIGNGSEMVYSTTTPSGKKHRLGLRPMPGITNVDIKSKSAYGSLREATINFVCWDIHQLEDLELLYMRPGFLALLEWGWSPYINNNDNYTTRINFDSNILSEKPSGSLQDIYKELYNNSINQSGNYDALLGFIKNFQWSFRPDGGYDCVTTIISPGEIIESLKINYSTPEISITDKRTGLLGIDLSNQNLYPSGSLEKIYDRSKLAGILYEISSYMANNVPVRNLKDKLNNINAKDFSNTLIDGDYYNLFAYQIDINNEENKTVLPNNNIWQYYITLESFCNLLNKYILLTSDKGNITKLSTLNRGYEFVKDPISTISKAIETQNYINSISKLGYEGASKELSINNISLLNKTSLQCLTHPFQLSVDPSICLINSPVWRNGFTFPKQNLNQDDINESIGTLGNIDYSNDSKLILQSINLKQKESIIIDNINNYFKSKNTEELRRKALEQLIIEYELTRTKVIIPTIIQMGRTGKVVKNEKLLIFKDFILRQGYLNIINSIINNAPTIKEKSIFQLLLSGDLTKIQDLKDKNEEVNKESEKLSLDSKTSLPFMNYLQPYFKDDSINNGLGYISNIYININYLFQLILNQNLEVIDKKEKNDINLYDYLKTVLNSVQAAIGNVNNFDIHVDPIDNIGRIIDINSTVEDPIDTYNKATIIEIQKADNISSFVRNVTLQSQIFPEQSSIVAISAGNGGGVMGLDNNTLVGFNRGIQDRIMNNKFSPPLSNIPTINNQIKSIGQAMGRLSNFVSELKYSYNTSLFKDNLHAKYSKDNSNNYKNTLKDIINYTRALTNDPNQFRSIIPTKLSISMDGLGGIIIGNIFRIPNENLPLGYKEGLIGRKVGYIVTGLSHKISIKDWETIIDAQTIILEKPDNKQTFDYSKIIVPDLENKGGYKFETPEIINKEIQINQDITKKFNSDNITTAVNFFLNKGFTDYQTSAIVGSLLQESDLSPTNSNQLGAYGIAQWLGKRKRKLQLKQNYNTIDTQLDFIIEEFNGDEKNAFNKIKKSNNIEEAILGMASYERYGGWYQDITFEKLLKASETGKRIDYSYDILRRIKLGEFK